MVEFKRLTIEDIDIYQSAVKNFRNQDVTKDKVESVLNNPTNIIYVAHDQRMAIGYVLCYRWNRMDNNNDIITIIHVFVLEAYQRQGIARHLMNMALEYAKSEQLHYVFVITQNDNKAANALYLSCGGYNHPKDKEIYFWYITGKPLE